MPPSPKNEIPDGEILFRYCYPSAFPLGQAEIPISVFQVLELSCDWKKYRSDPATSYHIEEGKTRIISITVCDEIRNPRNPKGKGLVVPDWRQEIIHNPICWLCDPCHGANKAHSLVKGRKKIAVCEVLVKNSIWFDL